MKNRLNQPKKLVSISEAAQILEVSLDTIRRWDKTGVLHSERPDGKNRFFDLSELKKFKSNQPLSISEASYELHISPTTLRRLVKKQLIQSSRNSAGERVFDKEAIKAFLASDYYQRKQSSAQLKKKISKSTEKTLKLPLKPKKQPKHLDPLPEAESSLMPTPSSWQLISGAIVTVVIFLLLTAIGITNIEISKAEASQPTQVETVLTSNRPFVVPLEPKLGKTKSLLNSVELITHQPAQGKPGDVLKINVSDDGLTYVVQPATPSASQIGSEASIYSQIDGFIIDSVDTQGYHLKLPDGSLGFIPFDKVTTEEPKTNE